MPNDGEQYPPAPQSESTRQLPGTHVLPLVPVSAVPWQAHALPDAQSVSCWHVSYVQKQPGMGPITLQRPFAPCVHVESDVQHDGSFEGQLCMN
jgi:hypothetical protein